MIISIEEAKMFLRVDGDEENTLIAQLIVTAEDICEGILRYPISELNEIPESIKQAILYATANMYEQRENFDVKSVIETMTRLMFSYRRESW